MGNWRNPRYHPSVGQVLRFFNYDHLPEGLIRGTSKHAHDLAYAMADNLDNSPELTVGLRKLLEAKDAFVRTALDTKVRLPKEPTNDE